MGEGADAGIAIHMDLRVFPRSAEDIEREGPVTEAEVPAISPELLATAITHEGHAGGPRVEEPAEKTTADD
jgi:thioredoxin reductase (NADPH)